MLWTAALVAAVAGCGGVPAASSSPAGSGPSAGPASSTSGSSARPTPRPSRVPSTTTAKPAATARPTAKPVAKATPRGTIYVVKAGDTLYAIAVRFKVTVKAILAANPGITNANQIAVGQKILIPTP